MNAVEGADPIAMETIASNENSNQTEKISEEITSVEATTMKEEEMTPNEDEVAKALEVTPKEEDAGLGANSMSVDNSDLIEDQQLILSNSTEAKNEETIVTIVSLVDQEAAANIPSTKNETIPPVSAPVNNFTDTDVTAPLTEEGITAEDAPPATKNDPPASALVSAQADKGNTKEISTLDVETASIAESTKPFSASSMTEENSTVFPRPTNASTNEMSDAQNNAAVTDVFAPSNVSPQATGNAPDAAPVDALVTTNDTSDATRNPTNDVTIHQFAATNPSSAVEDIGCDAVPANSYVSTDASPDTSENVTNTSTIDTYASSNNLSVPSRNRPESASMDVYLSSAASSNAPVNEENTGLKDGKDPSNAVPADAFIEASTSTSGPVTEAGPSATSMMHSFVPTERQNVNSEHAPNASQMDTYASTNAPTGTSRNGEYAGASAPTQVPGNLSVDGASIHPYTPTCASSGAPVNGTNLSVNSFVSPNAPHAATGNASNITSIDPYVPVQNSHPAAPSNDAFAPINVAPTVPAAEFPAPHNETTVSFTPTNASSSIVPALSYTASSANPHSMPPDAYTPINIGNQAEAYAPTTAVAGGGYNTANAGTQVEIYHSSTNAVVPELKMVTDAFPPPSKKTRLTTSPIMEPMGELRPTDVLAGNYRKRAGNALYKNLLRQYASEVGKTEMKTIVGKVYDTIANQNPPGRFIREGGDNLMSRAQTNQKIARALREVADRASAKLMEEGGGGLDLSFPGLGDRRLSKALSSPKGEPVGEIRPTDVLTGNYRKRPGNALYKKMLRENAPLLEKVETKVLVNRVIEGIANQNPPGRFIREGGTSLLTTGQIRQKVSRALKEVVDRSDRPEGEERPMKKARKSSLIIKAEEPIGEIRETDVLTGNYRKRRGNALYKALLRQNAPRVGKEEMKTVVKTVVDGIYQQDPPGRFIREGGGSMLSRGQVHQKVARALREVVDRANGVLGTAKPAEGQRREIFGVHLKQNQVHLDYKKNQFPGMKIQHQLMAPKIMGQSAGMLGHPVGIQEQPAEMKLDVLRNSPEKEKHGEMAEV